jgi:hypothetical protein
VDLRAVLFFAGDFFAAAATRFTALRARLATVVFFAADFLAVLLRAVDFLAADLFAVAFFVVRAVVVFRAELAAA